MFVPVIALLGSSLVAHAQTALVSGMPGVANPDSVSSTAASAVVVPLIATPSSFGLGGQYTDNFPYVWTINSAGTGTVTVSNGCTPAVWSVTGTQTGANFTLTATPPVGVTTGCVSFKYTMTFSDHNNATGTWANIGASGSGSITVFTRTGNTITLEGQDSITEGNWIGSYGAGGYSIPDLATTSLDHTNLTVSQFFNYAWAGLTSDPRALKVSSTSPFGIASAITNYVGKSVFINLNIYDTKPHTVSFYLLDWDTSARSETFTVRDASTNAMLGTWTFSGFHNGVYAEFQMKGNLQIQVSPNAAPGVAVSGIFID